MKKVLLTVFVLVLSVSLIACTNTDMVVEGEVQQNAADEKADEKAIASVVEGFGRKLQMVSLLAPKDVLEKSMKEHYGEFVSQALIEKWAEDPQNAPGRLTSSPWPNRIEILSIEESSEGVYEVTGEIIEITSAEKESGEIAAKRAITLLLKKSDNRWTIDDVILGDYS
jgi:hypothetical protein